ncbi:MAG: winged helix-turn-helix transcriptional regulator, partial [Solirubrobacteraceae bacterium]
DVDTVLIIEADDQALRARGDELLLDGYDVLAAQTDQHARTRLADGHPEAVVLGALDGAAGSLTFLRDLRRGEIPRADPRVPVLSIGADSDHLAVRHYQAGADLVLPTQSSPLLVTSGLAALAARTQGERQRRRVLRVGSLTVDCDARVATSDGTPVTLTRLEFDLLQTLAQHPHTVLTRDQLAKNVWNTEYISGRTIDSHAGRLRSKLNAAGAEPLIQTVRGVGYRLGR